MLLLERSGGPRGLSRLICTAIGECSSAGFRPALAALLVLAVLVEAAIAGPLENAAAAFQRGDYATTRRIMQSLAEQGDPAAQWRLVACITTDWARRWTGLTRWDGIARRPNRATQPRSTTSETCTTAAWACRRKTTARRWVS
jgi:hypothetical protein